MRVTANTAFKAVRNCQMLTFDQGAEVRGDIARYLLSSGADVDPADEEAEALLDELTGATTDAEPEEIVPVEVTPDEVVPPAPGMDDLDITATIELVLTWVGNDPERALAAFDAETARAESVRRKTLLDALTKIVED